MSRPSHLLILGAENKLVLLLPTLILFRSKSNLVLKLEVRVQMQHSVILHCSLGRAKAPFSNKVLEGEPSKLRVLDLLEFCSRPMDLKLLELSIVWVDTSSLCISVMEDSKDSRAQDYGFFIVALQGANCDAERISAGVLCRSSAAALFKFFNSR